MKICFVSQNGHSGKLPRDFANCRTEFAWQIALDADHYPIQYLLNKPAKEVSQYDVVIVILPKKLETIDTIKLLEGLKRRIPIGGITGGRVFPPFGNFPPLNI